MGNKRHKHATEHTTIYTPSPVPQYQNHSYQQTYIQPAQGLAPPPPVQQSYVQPVQGLTPPPVQQSYQQPVQGLVPPPSLSAVDRFRSFFDKYSISPYYHNDLKTLERFDIVVIADDSGSMSMKTENGKTRWSELKEVLTVVIELGSLLDDNGIDILFLNRGTKRGVRSLADVQYMFNEPPRYRTPLSSKTREAMSLGTPGKPMLLLIATDGEPSTVDNKYDPNYDSVDVFRRVLEFERDSSKVFVGILKCSNNDAETGYLDRMDRELVNLDVIDDYLTEKAEVQSKQGRNFNYTTGDQVARFLLGPIYPKYDNMDEKFVEY